MSNYALLMASSLEKDNSGSDIALNDLEAMQTLLSTNGFNVNALQDSQPQGMQEAIEQFARDKKRDDLLLFYYSGHGLLDQDGQLYLASNLPFRNNNQELLLANLFLANFLQKTLILNCRANQIVIILDCCYSAVFGQELSSKDSEDLLLKRGHIHLGQKQWVCLSSSSITGSYRCSPEMRLSPYTNSLTSVFPQSNCLGNLHELIREHLKENKIALQPQLYACDYNSLSINLNSQALPKTNETNETNETKMSKHNNNLSTSQTTYSYQSLSNDPEKIDPQTLSHCHGLPRLYNKPSLHQVKLTSQGTTIEISDCSFEQVKELCKLIKEDQKNG